MAEPTTTPIFHDADADPSVLAGKTGAVVGYGNQGSFRRPSAVPRGYVR